jgi:CRISPR/Cas system CSM-associated protein Csm5 (group 7 of RAMP superfamily)
LEKNIIEQDMKVKKVQDSFTFLATSLKPKREIWLYFKYKNYKNLTTKLLFIKTFKSYFEFFKNKFTKFSPPKKRGGG